jgi:hypothetical protein
VASQGPLSPGTVVNDSSAGTTAWSNPELVPASDNNYAQVFSGSGGDTQYLKATNFGFSIPSGATIDGIVVEWEKRQGIISGTARDLAVRIVKGGAIGSTDKSVGGNWPGADAYVSYGSSSDLWGETWSDSDINGSTFGCAIRADVASGFLNPAVDHVRITVHYTEGGAPAGGGGDLGGACKHQMTKTFRPGPFKPGNPK